MMANAGWTDQEIVDALIYWSKKHGFEPRLREKYYEVTIAKAREPLEQRAMQSELGEAQIEEEPEERTKAIRKALGNMLGIDIIDLVKWEGDPPRYWMSTTTGDITIGGVEKIQNQQMFLNKIADVSRKVLRKYKSEDWLQIYQAILDACREVNLGDASHPRTQTQNWMEAYISEKTVTDKVEEAVSAKAPFEKNGDTYLFADDLREWIEYRTHNRIKSEEIAQRLRLCEAEPEKISVRIGTRTTSRYCWRLPAPGGRFSVNGTQNHRSSTTN